MDISVHDLDRDPYPIFAQMWTSDRLTWVDELVIWFVTGYDDVQDILRDNLNFVVGTERSLIYDTFGEHMLTTEGELHERHKREFCGAFGPARIKEAMAPHVRRIIDQLMCGFKADGEVELRTALAGRMPVLSIPPLIRSSRLVRTAATALVRQL